MSVHIRHIRVYACPKCKVAVHDHAMPGGRFLDVVLCTKCKKPMPHTTEAYQIETPDPEKPWHRVARKLVAA